MCPEGDKVILETDVNGNLTARNIYGINLISRTTGGQAGYYFYNGHADATSIIGTDGTLLASYYYDDFGNLKESTGTFDNPFRYSGYQYDAETGTYYLMCRMYDPETGRFLQEDTYTGDTKDPLSLNLYTYCHNEPLMYDDPTGHFLNIIIGAVVGAAVGVAANFVSDLMDDGKINKGGKSYVGAAVEGAIVGGTAAATGGLSLLASTGAMGAASFLGNAANQYISKSKVNWKEAAISGAIGAAGECGGRLLGKAFEETEVGQAALEKVNKVVGSLKNNLAELREKIAQSTENSLGSIFKPELATDGLNIKLPTQALEETKEIIGIEKNEVQKNYLTAIQENEENLGRSVALDSGADESIAGMGEVKPAKLPVQAGEAGSYEDLAARAVRGDKLTPHHISQAAAKFTPYSEGGSLVLPESEHFLTRTFGGRGSLTLGEDAGLSFRQTLYKDIKDVRSIAGSKYDNGLIDLLDYYRQNFPELMKK